MSWITTSHDFPSSEVMANPTSLSKPRVSCVKPALATGCLPARFLSSATACCATAPSLISPGTGRLSSHCRPRSPLIGPLSVNTSCGTRPPPNGTLARRFVHNSQLMIHIVSTIAPSLLSNVVLSPQLKRRLSSSATRNSLHRMPKTLGAHRLVLDGYWGHYSTSFTTCQVPSAVCSHGRRCDP